MRRRSERGSALIMSLLMLALAEALLLAVTTRAVLSAQASRRLEDRIVAFNAAEGGLAEACQILRRDGWCDHFEREEGTVQLEVRVEPEERHDHWQRFAVTARGTCRGAHRATTLRVEVLNDVDGSPLALRRVDWTPLPGG